MDSKPRFGKDAGEVRVPVGGSFIVELPAKATAGYTWQLTEEPEVVALKDERIHRGGPGLGAPAVQEFEFLATRTGTGSMALEYKRPWEPTPIERLNLKVFVMDVANQE